MGTKSIDVVRAHIEAYRRKDVPEALSYLDTSVVLDPSRVGGPDVSFGHEAVAQAVARYAGTFDEYVYEVERLTDLGAGAVLAIVSETGRGKASGVPVSRSVAFLYSVIDGKIVHMTVFLDVGQALEAVGLEE